MADKVIVSREKLVAVADAVRGKTGSADALMLDELPAEIAALKSDSEYDAIQEDLDGFCTGMVTTLDNPRITSLRGHSFRDCTKLTSVRLENVTKLGERCFGGCSQLKRVEFGALTDLPTYTFITCVRLDTLIIRTPTLCTMSASNVFGSNAPAGLSIYVPDELVEEYKVATNWAGVADKIVPLSSLEV